MSNVIDFQVAQGPLTIPCPSAIHYWYSANSPRRSRYGAQTVSFSVGRYDVFDKSGSTWGGINSGVRIGDSKATVWTLR